MLLPTLSIRCLLVFFTTFVLTTFFNLPGAKAAALPLPFPPNSPPTNSPPIFLPTQQPVDPLSYGFDYFQDKLLSKPIRRDSCVFYCKITDIARAWAAQRGKTTIWEAYPDFIFQDDQTPRKEWIAAGKINDYAAISSKAYAHAWLLIDRSLGIPHKCIWETTEFLEIQRPGGLVDAVTEITLLGHPMIQINERPYWTRPGGLCGTAPTTTPKRDGNGTCHEPADPCPKGLAKIGTNGKCEKCLDGQQPSTKSDKCIPRTCADDQFRPAGKGDCQRCTDGMQPNAKADGCEKRCLDGQARVGQKGECTSCSQGKKPDPKGHSCIPIPDDEKAKKKAEDDEKNKAQDTEKKTARANFCYGLLATSAFGEQYNDEDLASLIKDTANNWPTDMPWKDGNYTDSNIETRPQPITGVAGVTAGIPGIGALAGIINGAAKGSKAADSAAEALAKGIRPGTKSKPVPQAQSAATMKQIRENPAMRNCLLFATGVFALGGGAGAIHNDDTVPEGGFKAAPPPPPGKDTSPDTLHLSLCEDEDCSGYGFIDWYQYSDDFWHGNWIVDGKCVDLDGINVARRAASAYNVKGGCCSFYKDTGCRNKLFSATKRQDMNLPDHGNNDAISSWACTHDLACKGTP